MHSNAIACIYRNDFNQDSFERTIMYVHVYKHCRKICFGYGLLTLNCFTHISFLFSWWRIVLHLLHIFNRILLNKINNFTVFVSRLFVLMYVVYFNFVISFWVHNNMATFVHTGPDSFLETFMFSRCKEMVTLNEKCAFHHVFVFHWRLVNSYIKRFIVVKIGLVILQWGCTCIWLSSRTET